MLWVSQKNNFVLYWIAEINWVLRLLLYAIFLDCSTLKLKALWPSETSVTAYQSTWCNIPEDLQHQQHQCENLSLR